MSDNIKDWPRHSLSHVIGHDVDGYGGRAGFGRLHHWARNFRGLEPMFPVMAVPPTCTRGAASSSINSGYYAYATEKDWNAGFFDIHGYQTTDPTKDPNFLEPWDVTLSDGSKTHSGPIRVRFMTTASQIDVCYRSAFGSFNIIVDGEIAVRDTFVNFDNLGIGQNLLIDFGSDTTSYGKAEVSIAVSAGGSGHAIGDIITLDGGSGGGASVTTPVKVRVRTVTAGAVTSVVLVQSGDLTAQPSGTFAQTATTGSGTGLQVTAQFFFRRHSAEKMRKIELLFQGSPRFAGITVSPPTDGSNATEHAVLPWRAPASMPKILFVGDSISAGTYMQYAGGQPGLIAAQMLGLYDRCVLSAQGGTGWNTDNGTALRWSHAYRIADFVAWQPDLVVFLGSQNDTAGSSLEAAVTATLNALLTQLPQAYFVGIGNVIGDSTALSASIEAGWLAASDQTRVRYVNNHDPIKWLPAAGQAKWTVTSDGNHLGQPGAEMFGGLMAEAIAAAVLDMVL